MVSRAVCEVCKQPKWIYDLNEYGQKIQIGTWDDGRAKYKVHGHQCQGPNYASAGQKVDKLHQKTNEAIKYVEDRAQSNHVNLWEMAANIAIVKEDTQNCKQLLETVVKKLGLFEGADTIMSKPQAKKDLGNFGPPDKRPDLQADVNEADYDDENEVSAAVEEIAGTDDTTHDAETGSINFVSAPEVS